MRFPFITEKLGGHLAQAIHVRHAASQPFC
jgi:hypothetical protein